MDIWTFQTLSFYSFRTWKLQFFRSIESREPIALHFRFTNQVDFDWDFTGTCDRGCSSICSSWPSNDHVRGTVWHTLAQFELSTCFRFGLVYWCQENATKRVLLGTCKAWCLLCLPSACLVCTEQWAIQDWLLMWCMISPCAMNWNSGNEKSRNHEVVVEECSIHDLGTCTSFGWIEWGRLRW